MPKPLPTTFERLKALVAITETEPSASAGRPTRTIVEAFTGDALAEIPVGTAEDAKAAIARARAAQVEWELVPPKGRAGVLERFASLVYANRESLFDMIQAETGKARQYAQEEVLDVVMTARHYAKTGPGVLAARKVAGMVPFFTDTRVRYQPKGVVGVISPWNYPMTLAVSDAVAALMAGNAVVIKPDSQTPFCALAVADLLYQAGLDRRLFAVVPGPGSVVGTALVENTDYLMFTGSSTTGATLAEQAGRRLIGFSAELGGKNPLIVTRDADLDKAAEGAVRACFSNSGQLCISIERIYVERPSATPFIEKFVAKVEAMTLAAGYDVAPDMGSLASKAQVEAISAHVEDAVAKGATVLTGGKARPDLGPLFYEPTVLTDVTDDMDCARSETFGPLVSIYPVDTIDEAVRRANDTEYGLNASVFAGDLATGRAIAARLRAGTVNLDEGYAAAWGSTAAPMGGMGISGVGRRHGAEGLTKYCESQTIAAQRYVGIGGMKGVPKRVFLALVPRLLNVLRALPGR